MSKLGIYYEETSERIMPDPADPGLFDHSNRTGIGADRSGNPVCQGKFFPGIDDGVP